MNWETEEPVEHQFAVLYRDGKRTVRTHSQLLGAMNKAGHKVSSYVKLNRAGTVEIHLFREHAANFALTVMYPSGRTESHRGVTATVVAETICKISKVMREAGDA